MFQAVARDSEQSVSAAISTKVDAGAILVTLSSLTLMNYHDSFNGRQTPFRPLDLDSQRFIHNFPPRPGICYERTHGNLASVMDAGHAPHPEAEKWKCYAQKKKNKKAE